MYNPFETINSRLSNIESLLLDLKHGNEQIAIADKAHFTKREAAAELSCSVPMIDKLIQQGRLDKVKVGAKVLIPREGIERILALTKKGRTMQSNIIQPRKVSLISESKDTKFRAQLKIVYESFLKTPCTMKELSIKTGIDRSNICWLIRDLRNNNKIAIYKR
ncbi:MAG: excisionase family DNA-binding protein [Saprospiraceae bacterium]|nr:excisionase family DNA-binding protein [Saprospiraceae bacterium]